MSKAMRENANNIIISREEDEGYQRNAEPRGRTPSMDTARKAKGSALPRIELHSSIP
jgi:hypothetical protein